MNRKILAALTWLFLVLFSVGCTHVHHLKPYDADAANLKASKTKKVAVVFLDSMVQQQYKSSAQGHTFVFEGARPFLQQAYSTALQGSVASTEFFVREPGPGFDVYLYPKLNIEVKSKTIGAYCRVDFEIAVKDRNGKEIGRKSAFKEADIVFIVKGDETCKDLLLHTYYDPSYGIFNMIDDL